MAPDLDIREYRSADLQVLIELNRYGGLAAAGVPEDADIYSGDLDRIDETYSQDRSAMLVGELHDEVVAMGGLREVDRQHCEILRMRVRPEHQGRGLGRAILQALEDRARQLGYQTAILITGPDQHPAIDLYERAGYRQVDVERHGELVGVRMAKHLAGSSGEA